MTDNPERDLDLLLMGAILARPSLLPEVRIADRELRELLEALRTRNHDRLKVWFGQRGVRYVPGQLLHAVQLKVRASWIRNRIHELTKRITQANQAHSPKQASAALQELTELQRELGE